MPRKPKKVSADAGCRSAANVTSESVHGVDLYVATGRDKPGSSGITDAEPSPSTSYTPKEAMKHKLHTEAGPAVYKMRKAIVEPVFGQSKEIRGFMNFFQNNAN
jgi:hypothetical protein